MQELLNCNSAYWGAILLGGLVVVTSSWSGCNKNAPECQLPEGSRYLSTIGTENRAESLHGANGAGVSRRRDAVLSISGLVKQPLHLSLNELRHYQTVRVRINDVHRDATFYGVHYYTGVPLRVLLEQAHVAKESAVFDRELDLTILVRNRQGEQVALSWGEVFFRNSADILIALDAEPKVPHKDCAGCHDESTYQPWRDQLFREIPLPKLIAASDFYSDRALEDVTAIEVVYLGQNAGINVPKKDKPDRLYSPEIAINHGDKRSVLKNIDKYPRMNAEAIKAGDGTGYHGVREYSGVSLREVLSDYGIEFDPREVILLSAPDGYRVVLSSAELMVVPSGRQILLADTLNGETLDDQGRFQLVIPHDIPADRWLMAVAQIDILRLERRPKVYVVGMGAGDTSLLTLEGISTIAKADVIIAPRDIEKRFAKYLSDRPLLFNTLDGVEKNKDGKHRALGVEERMRLFEGRREEQITLIKKAMSENKSVAFLDYGDPTIFGTWRFLEKSDIPREQIVLIPGVSSVNAAGGLLGRDIVTSGTLVITSPRGLEDNPKLAQVLSKGGETIAILIGLHDIEWTCGVLNKHFKTSTTAAIVYEAGYRGVERVVRTTVGGLKAAVAADPEKHLGIIYVGQHL